MSSINFVLNAALPSSIPVADKPLNLGGEIEYLPINAFQERFGSVYSDGISVDSKSRITPFNENIEGDLTSFQLKKQVEKVLRVGFENLVICNMGKFGHGVFASKDIAKNTVVAIYGGTIINGDKVSVEEDHALGFYGADMSVSTSQHRGIASFMQHLPEEPRFENPGMLSRALKMFGQEVSEEELKLNVEMYSTEFESAAIKSFVATENVGKEYLNYNGIPLIAVRTRRDVKEGEQLGFNYGFGYWLSRKITPEFFDRNGLRLSHSLYLRTFGRLNVDGFKYTGEYKPLIASLKQGKTSVKILGDDKKTHEVSVAKLMCALLNAQACRIEINPAFEKMFAK
jgi:hypothetical protein